MATEMKMPSRETRRGFAYVMTAGCIVLATVLAMFGPDTEAVANLVEWLMILAGGTSLGYIGASSVDFVQAMKGKRDGG